MKKLLAIFAATMIIYMGCSSESGNDETGNTETVNNFKNEDKSNLTSTFEGRKDFVMDNGYFKAIVSSGTGGDTISNWMFPNIGTKITGFEAVVKINENMDRCGIEWNDVQNSSPTYTLYWFNIVSDGKFRIDHCKYNSGTKKSTWTKIKEISKEESHIELTKLNKIKVRQTDSGKTEVYVNGYLVHTIGKENLKINPGVVGISYSLKSGTTYSSSTTAESWFRFNTVQTAK